MDHGLMTGMLIGGFVMMAVPVLFGLGVAGFVLHRHLSSRNAQPAAGTSHSHSRDGQG